MLDIIVGIALIVLGIYCLVRPEKELFGNFNKPSLAKRHLSPSGYLKYKRFVGVLSILVGIFIAGVAILRMAAHA